MSSTKTRPTVSGDATAPAQRTGDIRLVRDVFTLVPWRMRPRVVGLAASSLAVSTLDIISVAAMLPLTQMLTGGGEIPPVVQTYVVPLAGTRNPATLLFIVAVIVAVAFLGKNILTILLRWWGIGIVQRAASAAQAELLKRYTSASYTSHLNRSRSTIIQAITGSIPGGLNAVLLGYVGIVVDAVTVGVLLLTLLLMSPAVSLVALIVFGGGAVLIARLLKPWALRVAVRALDRNTEAWNYLYPAIEGFRESRIFRRETLFSQQYRENRREFAGLGRDATMLAELPKYLLEVLMVLGIILVAFFLFATLEVAEAFALLGVFGIAALRLVPAMNRIVMNLNAIRSGRPALQMLSEESHALAEDAELDRASAEQERDLPREDIIVDDLAYRYPGSEKDVLRDVSTVIRRGQTTALVGASGAGKTTFADILVGLLPATLGTVSVGGFDIAEYPKSWRRQVAMVSQMVYIWQAPLRDLITFGTPEVDVDEDRLSSAIRRARLTDVINGLEQGLDTVIGDGGSKLSGGQVQRVGIARALYADPQVLVLDEATSALDNETEHEITATIEALRGEVTVIVIAHRLSTVKNADEILFFSRGRLAGQGSMQQLRQSNEEFARLVKLGTLETEA